MKRNVLLFYLPFALVIASMLIFSKCLFAYTVVMTETSRSEYENGKLKYSGPGEFKYRFEIDEQNGEATVTEYTRLKDNSIIEWATEYVISYIDDGKSISSLLADKIKANQKVICLIGKPGTLAVEIIMIGDTFFEYCKASSGRFYLATGKIQKPISPIEDIEKQFELKN